MSKVGALEELAKRLGGSKGFAEFFKGILEPTTARYNEVVSKLRKSSPKYETELQPIDDWLRLLDSQTKTPRNEKLSNFVDPQLIEQIRRNNPELLRRVQGDASIPTGKSREIGWLGNHYDASGGAQMVDIIGKDKNLRATQLGPKYMVSSEIDPASRGLLVTDSFANNPRDTGWQTLLDLSKPLSRTDSPKLEDALRSNGVDWLLYPNVNEGVNQALRGKNYGFPGLQSFDGSDAKDILFDKYSELLGKVQNPSITVLNPKAVNVKSIEKKRGGLVQYCGAR